MSNNPSNVQPGIMAAVGQASTAKQEEKGPRKIKFLEGNWLVFEENSKLFATHFCNGGAKTPHSQRGIKQTPWFHKAVDIEKSDKCEACEEDIPKNLFMLVKVSNALL